MRWLSCRCRPPATWTTLNWVCSPVAWATLKLLPVDQRSRKGGDGIPGGFECFEVREVLRLWLQSEGLRSMEPGGVHRKTVRRYVAAAEELGLVETAARTS